MRVAFVFSLVLLGCGGSTDPLAPTPFEAASIEGYWQRSENSSSPQALPIQLKEGKTFRYQTTDKKWVEGESYSLTDNKFVWGGANWEIIRLNESELVLSQTSTVGPVAVSYSRLTEAQVDELIKERQRALISSSCLIIRSPSW